MKMTVEQLLEDMLEAGLPYDSSKRIAEAVCPLFNDKRGPAEAFRQEVPELALRMGLLRRH